MTAPAILRRIEAIGGTVRLDHGALKLRVPKTAPPDIIEAAKEAKPELLAFLAATTRDGWNASDWRGYFGERAGIVQFDGGEDRAKAEARAYDCCINQWLIRNPPAPAAEGRCVHCDRTEQTNLPLLAITTKPTVWVHDRCFSDWRQHRKDIARAELALVGVLQ
jgi:hypothetical protein